MDIGNFKLADGFLAVPLFGVGTKSVSIGGLLLALVFVVGIWWFASLVESSVHKLTTRYVDEPGSSPASTCSAACCATRSGSSAPCWASTTWA